MSEEALSIDTATGMEAPAAPGARADAADAGRNADAPAKPADHMEEDS